MVEIFGIPVESYKQITEHYERYDNFKQDFIISNTLISALGLFINVLFALILFKLMFDRTLNPRRYGFIATIAIADICNMCAHLGDMSADLNSAEEMADYKTRLRVLSNLGAFAATRIMIALLVCHMHEYIFCQQKRLFNNPI